MKRNAIKAKVQEWYVRNCSYDSNIVIYIHFYKEEMDELLSYIKYDEKLKAIVQNGFEATAKSEKVYMDIRPLLDELKIIPRQESN